jgi:hypothetical protein
MTGYPEAKDILRAKGWRGVLPLPARAKKYPPDGFTGKDGRWPNDTDFAVWHEQFANGNTCIRLPDDVVGIDVDAYGTKTGAQTLVEAEKRFGPLPPTYRATSREDGISGIRLYRVPAGTRLRGVLKFADLGVGDVDVIQHTHRYLLVSPSIHPEGRQYRWLDEATGEWTDTPPGPDELPELPEAWIDGLRIDQRHNGSEATPREKTTKPKRERGVLNVTEAMTTGRPSPKVAARLAEALADLAQGLSRHDTMLGHVMALLRYGRNGEPGVELALIALYRAFTETVGPDREGGEPEAMAEFERMCSNAEPLLADSPPPAPKRVQWGATRRL